MDKRYGEQYSALYREHWWWRAREAAVLAEVSRLRGGQLGGRFLDVGCGDALLFEKLSAFGAVEGVEPDADLVSEESRRRFRIHRGYFDETFHSPAPFDLILFLDVLEHTDDPAALLRRAVECLAPGGAILVTVPAYPWLWTRHDDLNHHRTRYTPRSLGALVDSAGCQMTKLRHLFHWLVLPKLLVRAWERLSKPPLRPPRIPLRPLNETLFRISRWEHLIAVPVGVPFGSSLLAVVQPRS